MHPAEVADEDTISKQLRKTNIALIGNPNSGKSSVFNQLTGLRQKVGNFPGVTVEKKSGQFRLSDDHSINLIDFPGTYSLHPNSIDERVVVGTLASPLGDDYPEAILYVVDITQLEKHLLLFTQLIDLELPLVLILNMADQTSGKQAEKVRASLERKFKIPVVALSARTGEGFDVLKTTITGLLSGNWKVRRFYKPTSEEQKVIEKVKGRLPQLNSYQALLVAHHGKWLPGLSADDRSFIKEKIKGEDQFESIRHQVGETMRRFDSFTPFLDGIEVGANDQLSSFTAKLDRILTHRVIGPFIFLALMFIVFQAIFSWATVPMDWIDGGFSSLSAWVKDIFPDVWYRDLITEGILAGLGGVLIFIPQIAILFFLIAILEEIGYMSRAVYLFDRLMQRFGLNGRSIVALISGGACAIPAVMSARTISNSKERLITILVTPFISCSARIPVYTVLIGFAVPPILVWKVFNLQGLAFMGLYLFGIVVALGSAWVFKKILKAKEPGFLLMEMPVYRLPVMRNVLYTVYEKVKAFTIEAGRIILAISIILWFLASYGPTQRMADAKDEAQQLSQELSLDEGASADLLASKELEASYAGIIGKSIEPAIEPLGFDWKIGIALFTSFAAREVFVGTMATIYSIGSEEDEMLIRERMSKERNPVTGELVYNVATSLSLLIFYVLAMQCMSTLAVVKRETNSWKWPIFQFLYMTGLAYLFSLLVYQGYQFFA